MRKSALYILFVSLFVLLFLFQEVKAISYTVDIISESFNVTSIDTDLNGDIIFHKNSNSTFGDIVVDSTALIKYDISSNAFSSFSRLFGGIYIGDLYFGMPNFHQYPHVFYRGSENQFYFFMENIGLGSTLYIYKYDFFNDVWSSIEDLPLSSSTTENYIGGFQNLISTQHPYYNALATTSATNGTLLYYNATMSKFLEVPSQRHFRIIANPINPTTDTKILMVNLNMMFIQELNHDFSITNYTVNPAFFSYSYPGDKDIKKAFYDDTEMILIANNKTYLLTNKTDLTTATTLSSLSISCNTLASAFIPYDLYCQSINDCVFVGIDKIQSRGMVVYYNGSVCSNIDVGHGTSTNKTRFYSIIFNPFDGKYWVGGDSALLTISGLGSISEVNLNTSLENQNFSIEGQNNIYSAQQCIPNSNPSQVCLNTVLAITNYSEQKSDIYNYLYCDVLDIRTCGVPCVTVIHDINTSEQVYFSDTTSCQTLSSIQNAYLKVQCDPLWEYVALAGIWPGFALTGLYNCVGGGFIYMPTTKCENTDLPSILMQTNDTLLIQGQCYNQTQITDLCSPENETVCGDNLRIKKCQRDETGFLSWNVTKDCSTVGVNFQCSAGRCQFVAPNSNAYCVNDANCASPLQCINNRCVEVDETWDFPIVWKYIILIIVAFIALIFPMVFAGREGVLAGLAFSSVICIALTVVLQLSVLIPVVYVILAGAVFAIVVKSTFTQ